MCSTPHLSAKLSEWECQSAHEALSAMTFAVPPGSEASCQLALLENLLVYCEELAFGREPGSCGKQQTWKRISLTGAL